MAGKPRLHRTPNEKLAILAAEDAARAEGRPVAPVLRAFGVGPKHVTLWRRALAERGTLDRKPMSSRPRRENPKPRARPPSPERVDAVAELARRLAALAPEPATWPAQMRARGPGIPWKRAAQGAALVGVAVSVGELRRLAREDAPGCDRLFGALQAALAVGVEER